MFASRSARYWLLPSVLAVSAWSQTTDAKKDAAPVSYLQLTAPRHVLADPQPWEGNEFPHTLSVLELKRDGFRYWGWYGLNEGRGIGLARSNDLVNWTKYEKNPLWTNAMAVGAEECGSQASGDFVFRDNAGLRHAPQLRRPGNFRGWNSPDAGKDAGAAGSRSAQSKP